MLTRAGLPRTPLARLVRAGAGVALAAGLLTACSTGSSSSPAPTTVTPIPTGAVTSLTVKQLLVRSQNALATAPSVRVAGANSGTDPFTIDMRYGPDGSTGTFTTGGFQLDLLQTAGSVYLKGPDQFWKQQLLSDPLSIPKVAGKWVMGPPSNRFVRQAGLITDLPTFARTLFLGAADSTKGDLTTLDGVSVIPVVNSTGTLYVDVATARPIELVGSDQAAGSRLVFSDYGTAPPIVTPAAADTVDATTLK